jgi:hypothetical protein
MKGLFHENEDAAPSSIVSRAALPARGRLQEFDHVHTGIRCGVFDDQHCRRRGDSPSVVPRKSSRR